MDLQPDEKVEYKLSANLRKGIEFVGGVLTITDQRFCFEPHPVNIQRGDVEFPIEEIEQFEAVNVLGVVPNGLKAELQDGTSHTLVVAPGDIANREEIVDFVQRRISA